MIFNPFQWLIDRIMEAIANFSNTVGSLVALIGNTPLSFTTQNPIVIQAWQAMVAVADIFLALFVVIGAIQMMYGDSIGSLRMTVGQFVGKAILTALLIHLSAFIGENLLILNNLLTDVVRANLQDFVQLVNNGQLFNNQRVLILSLVLTVVFIFGIFRVIFQAVKRIIRFNLLFVLSGPAFLTSFHPATAPVFSAWIRLYVITIFEQFVQFLTLGLGIQFLIATKQTGFTGFILAIALVNMTAEIPKLLERFGAAASSQGGVGSLLNTAVKAAILFG